MEGTSGECEWGRSRRGEKVSLGMEEDGMTFCFRAPAVCNDNEDVIALEECGEDVARGLRIDRVLVRKWVDCLWVRRKIKGACGKGDT